MPNPQSRMKDAIKTHKPLVTPAIACAINISIGPNGDINRSTIEPWTFAVINAEETFANEFCKTLIIIKPGTKNVIKEIPLNPALLSMAIEKTITKSKVVTIGAVIVCKKTFENLFTSFK